jgi:RES domain-containing protein
MGSPNRYWQPWQPTWTVSATRLTLDEALLLPWSGLAFRHVPTADPAKVLDTLPSALRGSGRWHRSGEHTLYLAGDRAIVLAEFARHMLDTRPTGATRGLRVRHVFQLRVELERVADLRNPETRAALHLDADPVWIRDSTRTQAVAGALRHGSAAQAILVPSMAFVDQPERWNLVVFREHIDPYPGAALTSLREVGVIRPADILGLASHPVQEPR